jgi:hypothetical protein
VVISNSSIDPKKHKLAAFNYLSDRAHKLPNTNKEKEKEIEQINLIAINNGHSMNIMKSYNKCKRNKPIGNIP